SSSSRTIKNQAFLLLYSSSEILASFSYDALYREDFICNSLGMADSIVVRTRAHFFVMRRESGLRFPEFSDTPVEFVRFGRSA
ncbi:MAG: hypothetical protein IJU76_11475, partial [Desulfovibrionaceae bacterium]|nr:hypothetical protein [Desulfovibrionaceae bacterium]